VALVGFGPDSDGDGFSDSFETAAGTDPNNAASTPLNGQPVTTTTIQPLTLTTTAIKLNFATTGSDSILLSGTLNVPAGFVANGQNLIFDIGGVTKKLTLLDNGSAQNGSDSLKLAIKAKKGVVSANPAGKFTATFQHGNFAQMLATTSGLSGDADIKLPVTRSVVVSLVFDNTALQKNFAALFGHCSCSAVAGADRNIHV
jgi:hypothetical protein